MSDDGPDWGYGEQRAVDDAAGDMEEQYPEDRPHDQLDDPHNQPPES